MILEEQPQIGDFELKKYDSLSMDQKDEVTVEKQLKQIEDEQSLSSMRKKIMQQVIDADYVT